MKCVITIEMDNADCTPEGISLMLTKLSKKVADGYLCMTGDTVPIIDGNGNKVGAAVVTD